MTGLQTINSSSKEHFGKGDDRRKATATGANGYLMAIKRIIDIFLS